MSSGKIKFLIDEAEAKAKLMETKQGQNMTPDKRNEYLKPFVLTTILREQMLNLVEDNEGVNIILKQENRGIKKDKFSSFVYGLYYIKQEEDRRKKRKGRDISKLLLFSWGHFLKRKNIIFLNINVKQKGEIYFYEKFTSRNKDRRNFIRCRS